MPAEHPARDMQDTLYLAVAGAGAGTAPRRDAAADAHVGDADPLHGDASAADPADRAGPRLSPRRPRPDPLADVHAGRRARRRRRHDARGSEGHAAGVRARDVRSPTARRRFRPSFFPYTEPSAELDISCWHRAAAPAARCARRPAGSRSSAAAWCTRRCSRRSATTPSANRLRLRRRHRAARDARNGASRTSGCSTRTTCGSWSSSRCEAVLSWLRELVPVPADVEAVAATLGLRGFEVASVEHGRQPVIDFEITANRPDCLSVIGLAREAAAAYGLPLSSPDRHDAAGRAAASRSTSTIEDAELLPALLRAGVRGALERHSPAWMRERLEAAGVRSISPIVDVTNYVMLEMGQPTHAFDLREAGGPRAAHPARARRREACGRSTASTARSSPRCWSSPTRERPQAIAGVMGGADVRDRRGDATDGARERVLQARVRAANEQAARAEDRSLVAVRARRRRQRGAGGNRARRPRCCSRSARPQPRRPDDRRVSVAAAPR